MPSTKAKYTPMMTQSISLGCTSPPLLIYRRQRPGAPRAEGGDTHRRCDSRCAPGTAPGACASRRWSSRSRPAAGTRRRRPNGRCSSRSEEHTSELQSHSDLVCRLLLEKKKKKRKKITKTNELNHYNRLE